MPRTADGQAKRARAVELYREGVRPQAIAERLGFPTRTILMWARQAGEKPLEDRRARSGQDYGGDWN